jgi:cytochrome c553
LLHGLAGFQVLVMATRLTVWLGLLAVLAATNVGAQVVGDAARGEKLAYTCLGCHGIPNYKNAYPTYSVPKLAGQHPEYMVIALKAYQSGERAHATMHSHAVSMTEQEMADVAAYLAGANVIKAPASPAPGAGTAPAAAQVCIACHGNDGVGIVAEYPTLSGQYADYLARALTDYKRGNRKNAVMAGFAGTLSEADIRALADYYSKQSPALGTPKKQLFRFSSKD